MYQISSSQAQKYKIRQKELSVLFNIISENNTVLITVNSYISKVEHATNVFQLATFESVNNN